MIGIVDGFGVVATIFGDVLFQVLICTVLVGWDC